MRKFAYFNGKIVDTSKKGLPLDDIGIIRGFAVFDYSRTYNGRPFMINDYFKRFCHSAKSIGLTVPIDKTELESVYATLLKKNKMKECAFRAVLTGGTSSNHIRNEGKGNFYIIVEDLPKTNPDFYLNGAKLITADFQRPLAVAKTSQYMRAVLLWDEVIKKGAVEVLYHHNNNVLECATSNVFIVKDGKVFTSKDNMLHGITRKVILSIAKKNKIPAEEKNFSLNDLVDADEVFITSSGKVRVMPIIQVDSRKIAGGKAGPVTKLLMQKFDELTAAN